MVNKSTLIGLFLLICVCFGAFVIPLQAKETNINTLGMNQTSFTWKGQQWKVNSYDPNSASTKNVWIDSIGNLHMMLDNIGGKWYNTKIESADKYKFGTYSWTVSSPILNIDRNAVSSMYLYVDDSKGVNIEATGWGDSSSNKLWFEVQPTSVSDNNFNTITPTSPNTTAKNVIYSFDWEPYYIHFNAKLHDGTIIADWNYTNASGIPQVPGNIIMETWLYNKSTSDEKDVEIVYSDFNFTPSSLIVPEVKSGVYDNCNFDLPSISWSESARCIGGNRGIVDLVVGQAQQDGLCFIPFPYNNGVPKNYVYSWVTSDLAEPYLKQLEKDNRQVILSIQPNNANVSDVLDLILPKYGLYKNILGINIDTEWKNTGITEHVNNTERDAWIKKIQSYNPEYKLFLTNFKNYTYFPNDSKDIVILYDEQNASQVQILNDYQEMATHFTNVGLYTGFNNSTPSTASDSEILEKVNSTKYILHSTWTIGNQLESSDDSIMPGLWGYICDSSSGKTMDGAVIYVYNDTWLTTYVPSANGEYWITNLDKGAYSVQATAPGYKALKIPTNFTEVSVRQDIAMEPDTPILNQIGNDLGALLHQT